MHAHPSDTPTSRTPAFDAVRLTLLYTAVFVEIGIAMPFMPVWLNALHLDPGLIGGLLALPIAVRIVATRPLMGLIDRGVRARRLLITGSLGLALTYALMPLGAPLGWPLLAVLIGGNAVAGSPLVPSIDYLTLAAVRANGRLDYARIRLGGSIGFLVANLVGGVLLGWLGERFAVPLVLTALALIATGVAAASPDLVPPAARPRGQGERPRLPPVLWLAVAAGALIQASHAAVYAFGSITWSAAGVPGVWIGALWAIGVASEIVLFAGIARVPERWRSPFRLLGLGAAAAVLRALGMALAGDRLAVLFGLQMLHGLTFGATQLGAMQAVSRFAPDGARGRAQGTISASTALVSAGATLACGAVYRAYGPAATFLMMAPPAIAGLCCVGLSARALRRDARAADTVWSP